MKDMITKLRDKTKPSDRKNYMKRQHSAPKSLSDAGKMETIR